MPRGCEVNLVAASSQIAARTPLLASNWYCSHHAAEAAASSRSPTTPLRVLEVGAGDGRLTQGLTRALTDSPVLLAATDSFANKGVRAVAPVETIEYQALARY